MWGGGSQEKTVNAVWLISWEGPQLLLAKVKNAFGRIGIFLFLVSPLPPVWVSNGIALGTVGPRAFCHFATSGHVQYMVGSVSRILSKKQNTASLVNM